MFKILMVRHGQASFGSPDYDRLSRLGERQSLLLGEHFARAEVSFDVEASGELRRQRDTARLAREKHRTTDELKIDASYNEYDSDGVFGRFLPQILAEQPELKLALGDDPYAAAADRALLRRLYFPVLQRWIAGDEGDGGHLESWGAFRTRVVEALRRLPNGERAGRAIVYTSGGVIAAAITDALDLSPGATLNLSWRIFNASVTVLHIDDGELTLGSFNSVMHLEIAHPELLTHL